MPSNPVVEVGKQSRALRVSPDPRSALRDSRPESKIGISPLPFPMPQGGPMSQLHHPRQRLYREAYRASAMGLAVNGSLAVAKLVGGVVGHSFAMLADAINSL